VKPLRVYTLIPYSHTASQYYRAEVVLETAATLGLPIQSVIDRHDAGTSAEERVSQFCESDIILLYQPLGDTAINNVRGVQGFLPSKRDGDWKWAPSFVIETDDNLFNVSPLNQAFKSLGVRDMNGTTIPLGHEIGVVQDGERKVLWYDTSLMNGSRPERRDTARPINLAKNRQSIASYRTLLEMADQVQCSTPAVEAAVRKEVTPRRTRVFPNLVRFDHYPQVHLAENPDQIKILWQGGIAHYEDWYPLREQLGRITSKYPQVHWVIWGAQFPWVNELIPPHRYTFQDWCPYQEYKLRLCMIGHDISLAPLSDNVFNCCRSAIKFYESSVLHKPAATLAQNTAAYRAEIVDGETALLFNNPDEFEEKLSRLIEDVTYRKQLAANAKDWVSENRDAMKVVPSIIESWERLREERTIEQPHVGESEWLEIEQADRAEQEAENGVTDEPVPALDESG